ncbi:MAG TPA: ABC transporter permease [Chthoniobacterales bacterium]|nr:ABC transporter permease [Chthoniobacterales bacterium]
MIADLKYALRMLLKTPAFTLIAVVTLALGIGANSAIFSVVDTVLLRPLPFPNADRIVAIWGNSKSEPDGRYTDSFPDFFDYRAQSQSFSHMAAYSGAGTVLGTGASAQELDGVAVDGDFFDVLGVKPMLGRAFTAEEAKVGAPNIIVFGHGVWQRAFGSDPKIVGQQVSLAGRSYTVLGIMPPGFKYPVDAESSEFVMPLQPLTPTEVPRRGSHFLRLIGRLKPGVTAQQAQAEMEPIAARLAQQYPDTNLERGVVIVPLLEDIVGDVRPALLVLLGAVALVLLIACANVANLLLARAAARSREIGIRTALGASRARIVRQLLAESFVLALLGGAGGLLLAGWGVDVLSALGPRNVPRLGEVGINLGVGAFTFGLAVLSTVVFGLVPALQISRSNVSESLQQGSKGSTGGLHGTRVRGFLVVSQVSLSLLLLAGAGLLIKSFFNLRATNPGFDPARLLVLDHVLARIKYPEPDQQRRFYEQMMPRLAALPGVESIGGANPLPFSGNDSASSFRMEHEPDRGPGTHPDASHLTVTPGYFRTMKVPLRSGRDFDVRDNETAPRVAMVNETFVRRFIPNMNPIGQHILLDRPAPEPPLPLQIIGVVGDTKQTELGAPSRPEFYQPFAQNPNRRVWLVFRTATAVVSGMQTAIARAIHEMDPEMFVGNVQPMETLLGRQLAQPKFNMMLLGVFAAVAMVLAAIGIYGVIAYSVTQRTREIGIRMALGAQRTQMLGMVLRQSLTVVAIGIGIGLLAAFGATRLLASLLYGVGANDVLTYASVVFLLGAAALLASYIPARRAMKVDPMIALRYE